MHLCAAFFGLVATVVAQSSGELRSAPPVSPDAGLTCQWTDRPPVIDGRGDDVAWGKANPVSSFRQSWLPGAPAAKEGTVAKLLWDREWLYFLAELEDADVSAPVKAHDGPLWDNDVFEIFLKPSADHAGYFEFEVSPAGAIVDAFFRTAESWRDPAQLKRDRFHLEARTTIHGTVDRSDDHDRGWTVEGRIPWSDFNRAGGRPAPGEVWRLNLARVNGAAPDSELSSIAPLTQPSFHRTAEFVSLRFAGPGFTKHAGWKNERLRGSPDGPPDFRLVRAWPELRVQSLVAVESVPNGAWMWVIQQHPYREGACSLARFTSGTDGRDLEPLLSWDEVAYGFVFHPRFAENGFVFFGMHGPLSKAPRSSRVVRYTVQEGRPDPASRKVILEWPSDGHNGAALAFGGDGMLFVSSGDGTVDSDTDHVGQNPASLRSKILRIDVDRPSGGRAYAVPQDNPFVGDRRFAPETWAYGLRNPWRMSFDRASGQLWVGENGQDLWEYARLIERGANYGWSRYEGSHIFRQAEPLGPHLVTFPTIEHPHSEFRSLTGGIVYRGQKCPELGGAYIYGDWGTGRLWAAKHDGTKLEWQRELCDTPFAISHITADREGELLIVDYGAGGGGAIYRLEAAPRDENPAKFPEMLSETGLFANTASLQPAEGVLPYAINLPAWHDGATAGHHLALPKDAAIEVRAAKSWQAPDDTVLAQTLTVGGRRIETRVLVKQQNDWAGYSYVWDAEQKDATLAPAEGADLTLPHEQPWRIPSRAECMMCHSRQANFALTLHEAQLNRGDQLVRWERMGLLRSNTVAFDRERQALQKLPRVAAPEVEQRSAPSSNLLPRAPQNLAKFAPIHDPAATLEMKARSYLGANCAHCHTMYGGGNSAMDFDWFLPLAQIQSLGRIPEHGTLDLPNARVIAPGEPGESVLIPRVARRSAGQMPPIGSRLADPDGVRLLAEWIASLRGE